MWKSRLHRLIYYKFKTLVFLTSIVLFLVWLNHLRGPNYDSITGPLDPSCYDGFTSMDDQFLTSHGNRSKILRKIANRMVEWRPNEWRNLVPEVTLEDRLANQYLRGFESWCRNTFPLRTDLEKLEGKLPLCPCISPKLSGRLLPSGEETEIPPNITQIIPDEHILRNNPGITKGGHWKPKECISRQRHLVVVPCTDRPNHLQILMNYLHPILQRQLLEYRIVVVDQAYPDLFNKAAMMNLAVLEMQKLYDFDCIIFHDVDMLVEDDRSIYTCYGVPTHIGAYVDKLQYYLHYDGMFGGVAGFPKEHFILVNGYSNSYFGWGGEDDDMAARIFANNLKKFRPPKEISRFKMMHHELDKGNPKNDDRLKSWDLKTRESYMEDGLRTLKYNVVSVKEKDLYTHISAKIAGPKCIYSDTAGYVCLNSEGKFVKTRRSWW